MATNRVSAASLRQSGVSMIEILVTMTIVAFGVLGILGLQARTLSFQKDSFDRRSAAEMVSQLTERMRANHLGFNSGNYAFALDAAAGDPTGITGCAPCTLAQVATRDTQQWAIELRRRIPGAAAYLQWDAGDPRRLIVSLAWPEPRAVADPLCATIATRVMATIPNGTVPAGVSAYRCYETAVFP